MRYVEPMNRDEARHILGGTELLPFMEGPIADVKQLASECLDAGIPVDFGRLADCGST